MQDNRPIATVPLTLGLSDADPSVAPPAPPASPAAASGPVRTAAEAFAQHARNPTGPFTRAPVRSLYIHIPFCSHKCHYCDFYSFVDTRDQQDAFVARLIDELRAIAPAAHTAGGAPMPLRTIFIGGGTPSMLRIDLWQRLLHALHQYYDLSLIRAAASAFPAALPSTTPHISEHLAEFTVECNPETCTPELLAILSSGGVTRISMGAQSFNTAHLRTLERTHRPESVFAALDACRSAGITRTSIDLIYAIPGQTLADLQSDLEIALSLGTEHLSCYNLIYEASTPMRTRLLAGEFAAADESLETAMFELVGTMLGPQSVRAGAPLHRYEVSNYARPGAASIHNLAYWRHEQYLAAGPSASGHLYQSLPGSTAYTICQPGYRYKNAPNLGAYLRADLEQTRGLAPLIELELPDTRRAIAETIMMGLRCAEGLPWSSPDVDDTERLPVPSSPDRTVRTVRTVLAAITHAYGSEHARAAARTADRLISQGTLQLLPQSAAHANPSDRTTPSRLCVTEAGWLVTDYAVKMLMPSATI